MERKGLLNIKSLYPLGIQNNLRDKTRGREGEEKRGMKKQQAALLKWANCRLRQW
jgi:hypothetical protein